MFYIVLGDLFLPDAIYLPTRFAAGTAASQICRLKSLSFLPPLLTNPAVIGHHSVFLFLQLKMIHTSGRCGINRRGFCTERPGHGPLSPWPVPDCRRLGFCPGPGRAAAWTGQLWVGGRGSSPVLAVRGRRALGKSLSCRQPQFPTCEMGQHGTCPVFHMVNVVGAGWWPRGHTCAPSLQCCQTLVSHRVDPSLRDEDGYTAADLAEYHGHQDCARFLRETAQPVSPTVSICPRGPG